MAAKKLIVLTLEFHLEDGQWVGVCRELGTSTFNKDIKKAREELSELVCLHLQTLDDVGEIERFFKKHRIRIHEVEDVPSHRRIKAPVSTGPHLQKPTFTESVAMPIGC